MLEITGEKTKLKHTRVVALFGTSNSTDRETDHRIGHSTLLNQKISSVGKPIDPLQKKSMNQQDFGRRVCVTGLCP